MLWYFVLKLFPLDNNRIQPSGFRLLSINISHWRAVLLYNQNKFPSVPTAHATNMEESYESMNRLLEKIQYEKYNWIFCGGVRVLLCCLASSLATESFVAFCATGVVGGNQYHYIHKWVAYFGTKKNVVYIPLINPQQIYLPPLHIKLWLC